MSACLSRVLNAYLSLRLWKSTLAREQANLEQCVAHAACFMLTVNMLRCKICAMEPAMTHGVVANHMLPVTKICKWMVSSLFSGVKSDGPASPRYKSGMFVARPARAPCRAAESFEGSTWGMPDLTCDVIVGTPVLPGALYNISQEHVRPWFPKLLQEPLVCLGACLALHAMRHHCRNPRCCCVMSCASKGDVGS